MIIYKNKLISKIFIGIGLLVLVFGFFSLPIQAASKSARLYFLPTSGTYEVGQNFSVRVSVDSGGQAINAVEDVLSFSKNTLQATSISKESTIIALWVKDPVYNNSIGVVSFGGGVPSPGFNGLGRLFRVYFTPIGVGSAWISYSSSAKVLANDGLGTNILASAGRADFTIKAKTTAPVTLVTPSPVEPTVLPISLNIYSLTHPDESKWYNKPDILFSWDWKPSITAFSYLINKTAKDTPNNRSQGLDTSISYTEVTEGTWYFHIKPRTSAGWGETAHYKIQIDISAPSVLKIVSREDFPTNNPAPLFTFEAKDELSGIDYIEVQIDKEEPVKLEVTEYQTPFLAAGAHKLVVKAVDKAGNLKEDSIKFDILPLAVPTIDYWTKEILFGEPFLAKGKAAPRTDINLTIVSLEEGARILESMSDAMGEWLIEYKEEILKKGEYKFYVTQETKEGIVSSPSKERNFEVLTNSFRLFGAIFPISALFWLITFLIIVVIALSIITYLMYKSLLRRKRKIRSDKRKRKIRVGNAK